MAAEGVGANPNRVPGGVAVRGHAVPRDGPAVRGDLRMERQPTAGGDHRAAGEGRRVPPDSDKRDAFEQSVFLLAKRMWARCPAMPEGVTDPESLNLEQVKALA